MNIQKKYWFKCEFLLICLFDVLITATFLIIMYLLQCFQYNTNNKSTLFFYEY